MQTPWGGIAVADAHVHFFSHQFISVLAQQKGLSAEPSPVDRIGALLGWEMPEAEPERLAERWAAELDRHGVERAVLIASVPGDEDSAAAAVSRCPDRFYGYFMLNPHAPDAGERAR